MVRSGSSAKGPGPANSATYWLTVGLLVAVPLVFSTAVYRMYSLPKFGLLLTGAAALVPLLAWAAIDGSRRVQLSKLLGTRHVLLVTLYLFVISISTIFGVSPLVELFGSPYNQMGLITHFCFFILFVSLILSVGTSKNRLHGVLWAMTITGLAVSTYAYMQFFGRDPFLQAHIYTFESEAGPVLRVNSTIGHSDYLGNFLLYVAPLGAGLALVSRGHARRIAVAAAILCAAAIVFTGTRGAWVGVVAGVFVFAALTLFGVVGKSLEIPNRPTLRRAGVAFIVILVLIGLLGISPASRNITLRARSFIKEGFTGAGRTLLWRDSVKMVIQYPLLGCGPEGFRTGFLEHKSKELARLAPGTNNESSHNSYIDSAVSYGLPGAILYVAIIASSFGLLIRAHRRSTDRGTRIVRASLISSLAAVVVHNVFIFDQISTGLYFFAFAALAQIASNTLVPNDSGQVASSSGHGRVESGTHREDSVAALRGSKTTTVPARGLASSINALRLGRFTIAAGCALFVAVTGYSIGLTRADLAINRAIAAAYAGDLSRVIEQGNRAVSGPDFTNDYRFLFANALMLYADNLATSEAGDQQTELNDARSMRNQALELAMLHTEQSLAHTLTPDSNYVLLAYLALQLGDANKLFTYATEAVRTDPRFSNSHWLMAEAHLARDEREEAANEARLALELNPYSGPARSAFKRARGIPESGKPEDVLRFGQALASKGNRDRALRVLRQAARKSQGRCPDCHSALAALCETANLYDEAISEWEEYAREAPERAALEKTALRIEKLRAASKK
ncbi:MAG TPA: O-antigen ligase family protein [Blastocatellia bacterium]|nr:O-antigen ligase family protein [Blastocatellia bacterium]